MFNKVLDHLEEWVISFLMAAATLLIFVAVLHRHLAGVPYIQDYVLKFDLSWAQTLCTIMFVWMCKFGAAYGVRTGIHVGVDVVINRMSPKNRGRFVIFGLSAGALFTGVIAALGAVFIWKNGAHHAFLDLIGQPNDDVPEGPTDPDLEWPTWIIYLAIPLGSALMSYRFIQVCIAFWKTGQLPKHDESHVQGIEEQKPLHVEEDNKK